MRILTIILVSMLIQTWDAPIQSEPNLQAPIEDVF